MLMTCCAYSCTQYGLHTQYMLLTHADDVLCLQLHTVQSPYTVKGKAIPLQVYYRPYGFQEVEAPRF